MRYHKIRRLSEETKRKISESLKGNKHPMYGKHHTEEAKKKMSESTKGDKHHNYGKHLSDETKRKISISKMGELNPAKRLEVREKISLCHKGKILSLEARKKIGLALKGKYTGKNNSRYGKHLSTETKQKMSESHKGKHVGENNPMYGKNLSEEHRRKISASAPRGENNHNWKGEKVGYHALHDWVRRKFGVPTKCESCGIDGLTGEKIHWANKTGQYLRDRDDWIRLCAKCHNAKDKSRRIKSMQLALV